MKHYLQYHKIHELGRPTSSQGEFMVFTGKPVSDNYLGQTVWLLSGEKQGERTVYQLEYAFVVSAIDAQNGRHVLRGEAGFMPSRPTPVRFAPWLVQMQKAHAQLQQRVVPAA